MRRRPSPSPSGPGFRSSATRASTPCLQSSPNGGGSALQVLAAAHLIASKNVGRSKIGTPERSISLAHKFVRGFGELGREQFERRLRPQKDVILIQRQATVRIIAEAEPHPNAVYRRELTRQIIHWIVGIGGLLAAAPSGPRDDQQSQPENEQGNPDATRKERKNRHCRGRNGQPHARPPERKSRGMPHLATLHVAGYRAESHRSRRMEFRTRYALRSYDARPKQCGPAARSPGERFGRPSTGGWQKGGGWR